MKILTGNLSVASIPAAWLLTFIPVLSEAAPSIGAESDVRFVSTQEEFENEFAGSKLWGPLKLPDWNENFYGYFSRETKDKSTASAVNEGHGTGYMCFQMQSVDMSGRKGNACDYIKNDGDQLGGIVFYDEAGRIYFDRYEQMSVPWYNNSQCYYAGVLDFENVRERSKQYCVNYLGEYDQFENTLEVIKAVRFCDRECLHDGALFYSCPWEYPLGFGFYWVVDLHLPGEPTDAPSEGFRYLGSFFPEDSYYIPHWYVPDNWLNNTEIMARVNQTVNRYLFNAEGMLILNYTDADQGPNEFSRPPRDYRTQLRRFPPADQLEQCTEEELERIKTFSDEQPATVYYPEPRSSRSIQAGENIQTTRTGSRTIKLFAGEYSFQGQYLFDHQETINFEPALPGADVTVIIDDPGADALNLQGVVRLVNTRFNFRDIKLVFKDTRSLILTNDSEFVVSNGKLVLDPLNRSGNTLVMVSNSHFRLINSDLQNKMEENAGENPVTLDVHAQAIVSKSTLSSDKGGVFTLDKNARLAIDHSVFTSASGEQPETVDSLHLACHSRPREFSYSGSWEPQFELLNVSFSDGKISTAFKCGRSGVTPEILSQGTDSITPTSSSLPTAYSPDTNATAIFDNTAAVVVGVGLAGITVFTVVTALGWVQMALCREKNEALNSVIE